MISDSIELHAGPFTPSDLRVVSFRGREAISELFSFQLVVQAPPELEGRDAELLGRLAIFVLRDGRRAERRIEALIDQVRAEAAFTPRTGPTWHLRLVPPLTLLRRRTTSRIFQDETVPQILQHVLAAASLPVELRLSRTYAVRSYCVQYRESDLAFVRRLAAEEGIALCFADAPDLSAGTTARAPVIFLDNPAHYAPAFGGEMPAALVLRPDAGLAQTDLEVVAFSLQRALKPGAVHLRDYDFRRPNLVLSEKAGEEASKQPPLEVYQHHADYDTPEVTPDRARAFLEQVRRRAVVGSGESWVRELAPGRRFELSAEASPGIEGAYAVTRVVHEGHTPELSGRPAERTYRNRFECVPATMLLRPRAPTRKPRQVLETAVVTGPAGHEVHTDEHARVKVQFHWDLQGQRNDKSSAWLRVAQSWAGASFGSQFVPRVGMEVLVGFLGGDTDCPVVLGCLYNATHPPPFPLPADKLKSGLRTQSSPGAGGANELSFDDRSGAERVLLRAARDLEEVVANDHRLNVTGQQAIVVGGSRQETVSGSQTQITSGDRRMVTLGSQIDQVAGTQREEIGGGRSVVVYGVDTQTVKGSSLQTVEGEANLRVQGSFSLEVGTEEDPRTVEAFAWGDYAVGSANVLRLRGEGGLVLCAGESRIELTPKGITLKAPKVSIAGIESVDVQGDGPRLRLNKEAEMVAETVRIYASESSVELDKDAHINGKLVKLNCGPLDPDDVTGEDGKPSLQHLKLKLSDVGMTPYAHKDYVLKSLGVKVEGKTDAEGVLEAHLPAEARTAEVTLWIEPRPTGKTKRYVIALGELASADSVPGVESRLRNLGYYWGRSQTEITGDLARALRDFQQDHGLEGTGRADAATRAKLVEIHGT
ncbi:type VI secretion system tip protein TssI/VgrG [Sorangium cellulosum]|uniref:type VI secretion system tip protein TssI/VgrG n=1 Tax=Sorangium cellulosum TaxID=56 RepID=UPI0003F4B38D|nr:type VI secretion system tip protein TssI/VgrG [Sorangium cellulosum]